MHGSPLGRAGVAALLAVLGACSPTAAGPSDPPSPDTQVEIRCGGSMCHNEATRRCFTLHDTISYTVVGRRPAGGLVIRCGPQELFGRSDRSDADDRADTDPAR